MTGRLLLGTDNGYVVRRNGPSDYEIVYTSSTFGHGFYAQQMAGLLTDPTRPQRAFVADDFGGSPFYPTLSDDGGNAWTSYPSSTFPPPYSQNFVYNMDKNGALWGITFDDPGLSGWWRSDDRGATWSKIYDLAEPDATNSWIDDLAWTIVPDDALTPHLAFRLVRADLDGSNYASFSLTLTTSADGDPFLWGWYGSAEMYAHDGYGGARGADLIRIDISNPASPTSALQTAPFGSGRYVIYAQPIIGGKAIALAMTTDYSQGEIWYSSDAGLTWSNVVALTSHLGDTATHANIGSWLMTASHADPLEVYAATKIPYVWVSTDGGASWSEESCNVDLGAGGEWAAIAVTTPGFVPRVWGQVIG